MKKKREEETKFRLVQFRWLLFVDSVVVVGAVMSFGLVAKYGLGMNKDNALLMLAVIPPMAIATGLTTAITLYSIRKRLSVLLNGIQTVADGELDVQLETKGAEEYRIVYENFNLMVKELKGTKAEMEQFTNDFSHEFKTPITSIRGFAQYLVDTGEGIESPERMQYLQVIADESMRLSELSQNTLMLSKVEACQIITDKENFDLSEQVKRCTILLLPQIEKKKINLELDLPEISYYGNPELLEQVWLNLINNAIKFTPENGEISFESGYDGDHIFVSISDSGAGMDSETAARIFEKYYQGRAGRAKGGNGIGLSIVHRIVTLCGGHVEVTSSPGAGSIFKVCLPVQ